MVDARVVRALDLYFEGPELSSRSERYVHDSPEFKSSATLVNNKLVCLLKVVLFYFFFNHVMSDSTTVLRGTSSSVGYTEDSENP